MAVAQAKNSEWPVSFSRKTLHLNVTELSDFCLQVTKLPGRQKVAQSGSHEVHINGGRTPPGCLVLLGVAWYRLASLSASSSSVYLAMMVQMTCTWELTRFVNPLDWEREVSMIFLSLWRLVVRQRKRNTRKTVRNGVCVKNYYVFIVKSLQ
jgi:hypothetical protein